MAIEPIYVVDTNALLWYLIGDKKLTTTARVIFTAAEQGQTQLYISVMTLAELYYINQRWRYFADFDVLYQALVKASYFHFVPFIPTDVLDFGLDQAVPEMHDRIITGLARRLQSPLISSDPVIKAANLVQVIW